MERAQREESTTARERAVKQAGTADEKRVLTEVSTEAV